MCGSLCFPRLKQNVLCELSSLFQSLTQQSWMHLFVVLQPVSGKGSLICSFDNFCIRRIVISEILVTFSVFALFLPTERIL